MSFDPTTAAIRFGMGLSPKIAPPTSVAQMMSLLRGPDIMARVYAIPGFEAAAPTHGQFEDMRIAAQAEEDATRKAEMQEEIRQLQRSLRGIQTHHAATQFMRVVETPDGLRERLVRFWADHFSVAAKTARLRHKIAPYIEDAIRPHVAGPFSEMLAAVVTHPMMILYLDQDRSVGPNSPQGERRERGLNENLAREVLELHTLGVGGPYDQTDVRELAELFTGLAYDRREGFVFRRNMAEPGAETVLGASYGGPRSGLGAILRATRDLATHPATAAHLARKLAVHFVADEPPEAVVAAMEAAYRDTGGDLAATVEAMLGHAESWGPARKVKQPWGFIASAFRALAVEPAALLEAEERKVYNQVLRPMTVMGQQFETPPGPDGFPEAQSAWITPQGMAGRITWAMAAPAQFTLALPDPRAFVETALGPHAPAEVQFAAARAERVQDGIGVVLASAAFQRR